MSLIGVSVRQEGTINRHGKLTGYAKLPFQRGDDIIIKGTLRRVDSYEHGILNMVSKPVFPLPIELTTQQRYILVAALNNKLGTDQLRSSS
jgi:hypothetical protein